MKVGLWGSFDAAHPRTRLLVRALEALGHEAVDLNVPMWPPAGERASLARAPWRKLARYGAVRRALARLAPRLAEVDVLLVPYPGHLDMPQARALAHAAGKKVLFDPFLSLYDTAVTDRALFKLGSPIARLIRWVDARALRAADGILADTAAMADYYAALANLSPDRFADVPVGADDTLFVPAAAAPDPKRVEVLFYGSMLPLHGVEVVIAAATHLRDMPEVHFRLIGEGPLSGLVQSSVSPNLTWEGPVAPAALPGLIARADLCLGLFGTSAKAARVVPHKVYEAAAVGRCVVTRHSSALEAAFGRDALAFVPAGDAQALAAMIRTLARDPARRESFARLAQERYTGHYDTAGVAEALAAALARFGP